MSDLLQDKPPLQSLLSSFCLLFILVVEHTKLQFWSYDPHMRENMSLFYAMHSLSSSLSWSAPNMSQIFIFLVPVCTPNYTHSTKYFTPMFTYEIVNKAVFALVLIALPQCMFLLYHFHQFICKYHYFIFISNWIKFHSLFYCHLFPISLSYYIHI